MNKIIFTRTEKGYFENTRIREDKEYIYLIDYDVIVKKSEVHSIIYVENENRGDNKI